MTNLFAALTERRSSSTLSFSDWMRLVFEGHTYPLSGITQTLQSDRETVADGFTGLVEGAYKRNGVVFACMLARLLLFSEARFQFRALRGGRPGDLFGNADLNVLERPWPGGTTGDLLTRAIQDVDIAGNAFFARRGEEPNRIRRLRPDWVTIMLGSHMDPDDEGGALDAEPIGYLYHPGGRMKRAEPVALSRSEIAHFAPVPDPTAVYRGMSWLTPVLREITADSAATSHKLRFFENGATPNMVVSLDPTIAREEFDKWVAGFDAKHKGTANAYKTIFLGGGAKVEVVGSDLKQLDFKSTQGAGETRIAAAAGVPPVIVGLSEGLQAATYSNYGQARRRFADGTIRPLWRNFAGSLETIIRVPAGAQLWYDDRDIPFLAEDAKDKAEMLGVEANMIRTLGDAGFKPASVVAAVQSQDWSILEHSGLYSVQLQPAGSAPADDAARALAALIRPHLPALTSGDTT